MLDPEKLRQGYFDSLEQQKEGQQRQRALLKTLHKKMRNLEQQRQKLTEVYLDIEIGLTKQEYLEQKNRIESQMRAIQKDIETIQNTMPVIPSPMDFETLESFANEIQDLLEQNVDPSDKDKRLILEILHAKVIVAEDGGIKVEGWFAGNEDKTGKLSNASRYS